MASGVINITEAKQRLQGKAGIPDVWILKELPDGRYETTAGEVFTYEQCRHYRKESGLGHSILLPESIFDLMKGTHLHHNERNSK